MGYLRIEKINRKEYKRRKANGEINPLDDIYKVYDYKGRIIYTIYRSTPLAETEEEEKERVMPFPFLFAGALPTATVGSAPSFYVVQIAQFSSANLVQNAILQLSLNYAIMLSERKKRGKKK